MTFEQITDKERLLIGAACYQASASPVISPEVRQALQDIGDELMSERIVSLRVTI